MQRESSPLANYPKKFDLNQSRFPEIVPEQQKEQQETEPEKHSHDGEHYHSH
jgi:hypothetical protein